MAKVQPAKRSETLIVASIPDNEQARLAALRDYRILDTLPEESFDELTRLASIICGTPIALVSLVDSERQWFKSRVGLEPRETHRDLAFCAHAINAPDDLLVVEDTLHDQRFIDNPLVTGAPNLRFYAGCPLVGSTGAALGTLCVLDRQPKSLSPQQREALRVLAHQVMAQLELRYALRISNERARQLEAEQEAREKLLRELTEANAELEEFAHAVSHDLKAPLRVIENASRWLEEDLGGRLDQENCDNLKMVRGRVRRMSKLLDDLLAYSRIGLVEDECFSETLTADALLDDILAVLPVDAFTIKLSPALAGIKVHRMPLQQVLMNLIGNAIKHHDRNPGFIEVTVTEQEDFYCFEVKDDGPGIPEKYYDLIFKVLKTLKPKDVMEGSGMGLAMVRRHIAVFGGSLHVAANEGRGSIFSFTWPKKQLMRGAVA